MFKLIPFQEKLFLNVLEPFYKTLDSDVIIQPLLLELLKKTEKTLFISRV